MPAYRDVREAALPTVYVPLAQYDADAMPLPPTDIILGVRAASGPPDALKKAVTAGGHRPEPALRPDVPAARRAGQPHHAAGAAAARCCPCFFGALAVLMAAIGLYGVTSYAVNLRRAEIGVRLALGSTRSGVMRLVLGRVTTLVAIGVGVGLAVQRVCGALRQDAAVRPRTERSGDARCCGGGAGGRRSRRRLGPGVSRLTRESHGVARSPLQRRPTHADKNACRYGGYDRSNEPSDARHLP